VQRFDAKPYQRAYGDFGIVDSGIERVVASLEAGGNPLVTEAPKCSAATRCEGHGENAWPRGAYQRALGDAITAISPEACPPYLIRDEI
jgi:hypothetical protein